MITETEDFFSRGCGRCARFDTPDCAARRWTDALAALRALCLEAGLEESLRWGHPCYRHASRNIAILGAFREDCRLTFFDAALLEDPEGVLTKQGPNTRVAGVMRFSDARQVAGHAETIRRYLREAMGYAEAGIRPEKPDHDDPWPEELTEGLAADPELAEAFSALTPGRQRSYLLHLNAAKQPDTRRARLQRSRAKILAGKGAQER